MVLKKWSFYILLLLGFQVLNSQENLKYKLKKNEEFKVYQKAVQDIKQDMNGSIHSMQNLMEADYTFNVNKVTDSSYILNFKFDRFKLKSTSNIYGDLVNINTDSVNLDNMEAKIFSGLIKTTLSMEMLKSGKVLSVDGTEELLDSMIDNKF